MRSALPFACERMEANRNPREKRNSPHEQSLKEETVKAIQHAIEILRTGISGNRNMTAPRSDPSSPENRPRSPNRIRTRSKSGGTNNGGQPQDSSSSIIQAYNGGRRVHRTDSSGPERYAPAPTYKEIGASRNLKRKIQPHTVDLSTSTDPEKCRPGADREPEEQTEQGIPPHQRRITPEGRSIKRRKRRGSPGPKRPRRRPMWLLWPI